MKKLLCFIGILSGKFMIAGVETIQFVPVATLFTPHSILEHKELYKPLQLVDRWRYATCTSALWLDNEHLAVLNLYGEKIDVYTCDMLTNTFHLVQTICNEQGARLTLPEHLDISSNGRLLLVGNSYPPSIAMYTIQGGGMIHPMPLVLEHQKNIVHNVRFTPNSRYCACATFDPDHAIRIYEIVTGEKTVELRQVYRATHKDPLRAKGITFTRDGRYMITVYAFSLSGRLKFPAKCIFEVYEFDQERGVVGQLVCQVTDEYSPEDLIFSTDDQILIVSDQSLDALIVYAFDPATGILTGPGRLIRDQLGLTFPHGTSLSADGNYFAVANYGDDSVKIYKLQQ